MKKIFYSLFLVTAVIAFFAIQSCSDESLSDAPVKLSDTEYFKQNVSFFDARVRSISKTSYVSEIYFVNLGDDADRMPSQINFQGVEFFDDGAVNDLVSGDGIYTSSQTFNHDDRIQYNERELTKSVLESPIVDSEFAQSALLHKKMDNYDLRKGQIQSRWIEVTCDVEFGTSGCLADEWGWCNSCCVTVDLSSCSLTVGI